MHPDHHGAMAGPPLSQIDPLSASALSAFRRATHLNRQLFLRISGDKGGHPGRAIVLGMLAGHEGIAQRDLAEKLHLARPTVTTMLQKLEHEGLVERWDDPDDQRLTRIRLTKAGRAQNEDMGDVYGRYVNATFGAMSDLDRTELTRLLDVLNESVATALKELDA